MSLRKKNKTCLESFGSGEPELFFVCYKPANSHALSRRIPSETVTMIAPGASLC